MASPTSTASYICPRSSTPPKSIRSSRTFIPARRWGASAPGTSSPVANRSRWPNSASSWCRSITSAHRCVPRHSTMCTMAISTTTDCPITWPCCGNSPRVIRLWTSNGWGSSVILAAVLRARTRCLRIRTSSRSRCRARAIMTTAATTFIGPRSIRGCSRKIPRARATTSPAPRTRRMHQTLRGT